METKQKLLDGVYVIYHKDVQMKMFAKRYDGRWYYFGPGYADMGADGEAGYPCEGEDELVEILAGPLETYTITPDSCGGDAETINRTIRAVNAHDDLLRVLRKLIVEADYLADWARKTDAKLIKADGRDPAKEPELGELRRVREAIIATGEVIARAAGGPQ